MKPLRVCAAPGCGRLTRTSRCPAHRLPPRGRLHRRVRAQVLAEETRCWLCGDPGSTEDPLTLDHVVPRALGGPTTRANGRAAHLSCNLKRGVKVNGGVDIRTAPQTDIAQPRFSPEQVFPDFLIQRALGDENG
jgi:5-methylcytosine-specific restriction endonuclease McrA